MQDFNKRLLAGVGREHRVRGREAKPRAWVCKAGLSAFGVIKETEKYFGPEGAHLQGPSPDAIFWSQEK